MKGFKHIAVKGDSDFVINQFGKPWETTDLQLRNLCLEAMKLSRSFHSFSMEIIPMVMVYLVIWTTKLSFSVGYYLCLSLLIHFFIHICLRAMTIKLWLKQSGPSISEVRP
jgi:hypothetical protein